MNDNCGNKEACNGKRESFKKTKTITAKYSGDFDCVINQHIKEGWAKDGNVVVTLVESFDTRTAMPGRISTFWYTQQVAKWVYE